MARGSTNPALYLAPPEHSFWKWGEEGQVVTWSAGETIAFRSEIEQVLRRLAPAGLPPFSPVLLVLAACRDSLREALGHQENLVGLVGGLGNPGSPELQSVVDGLIRISQLPGDLRHPIEAKAGLVEFLFETGANRTSPQEAEVVCNALLLGNRSFLAPRQPGPTWHQEMHQGLASLINGLGRFDEESFRLRQLTGLDQLLRPAGTELPPMERARELISNLQDDREFEGLARVARNLMAVVHMPRSVGEPEELPVGGFSDISNRGPLDRLLVSELAHDNLTLAVRIALNEALYLRREAPPKMPPQRRAILIDAGIRLWGVPRVFAAAVAMALVATAERHAEVSTYRAKGDRIEEVDLTTRNGLVEHLATLEPDPHPGKALAEFLARAGQRQSDADCIVVTAAGVAADREFRKAVARLGTPCLYVATVNSSGEFQLAVEGARARKAICAAKLDLEDLLSPRRRPTVPLVDWNSLPAILQADPFPLRLPPSNVFAGRAWVVHDCGAFQIPSDGRLLLWDTLGQGPRHIADLALNVGTVQWSAPKCRSGKALAVVGDWPGASLRILSIDPGRNECEAVPLELDDRHYSIAGHGGVIFAISDRETHVLGTTDGRRIQTIPIAAPDDVPGSLSHDRGRFFRHQVTGAWFALSYDGRAARLDEVVDRGAQRRVNLVAMFDWVRCEGPVGITRQGNLYFPAGGELRKLADAAEEPIEVHQISNTGEWLSIAYGQPGLSQRRGIVEVAIRRLIPTWNWMAPCFLHEASKWIRPFPGHLHKKFSGVLACDELGLALISRKGWCWQFELQDDKLSFKRTCSLESVGAREQVRGFADDVSPDNAGYRLRAASWQDGSRAYLDSRRLLHLQSADPGIPEVSLVLADGEIGGWCSDGRLWGAPYFVGDRTNAGSREIYEEVIRPFFDRLS